MKTSLDHLPEHKRRELDRVVRLIFETVAEYRASNRIHGKGKYAKPASQLKDPDLVILFGSHARGEQVDDEYEEDGITYVYRSDFDILVVMETCKMARDFGVFRRVEEKVAEAPGSYEAPGPGPGGSQPINPSVGPTRARIISHTPAYVNEKIDEGQYFFTDIRDEGIVLYDSGRVKLAEPGPLEPARRKAMAQHYFDTWFQLAGEFYHGNAFYVDRGSYNVAAFHLHQAVEHFYATVLLVHTNYKPKLHDIEELGARVANLDAAFMPIFPRATKEDERRFRLLKAAYVDARYDRSYSITREDLEYLAGRVRLLRDTTEAVCKAKIAGF